MDFTSLITAILSQFADAPFFSAMAVIMGSGAIATAIFSILRRPRKTRTTAEKYFQDDKLLAPPTKRPAYSDRMSYVLAEMSELAYFPFEGEDSILDDAMESIKKLNLKNRKELDQFLKKYSSALETSQGDNKKALKLILRDAGFELIQTIDVGVTQAFVCRRVLPDEPPYMVIAFRGTEKKVSDWLTDLKAIPKEVNGGKVHTGFHEAFNDDVDDDNMTVADIVTRVLNSSSTKDDQGGRLPLFLTGHSLGGALALIATRTLARDEIGACYTFGGPRVGNYEYFEGMKTPVYRVVNSSDAVPRVPPGAGMILLIAISKMLSWATGFYPALSKIIGKLETFLDRLNGYRHVGDLRYLTDVAGNRFHTVKLLSNPPAIDRIIWLGRSITNELFMPVRSHSMSLYRKKLQHVASTRNQTKSQS